MSGAPKERYLDVTFVEDGQPRTERFTIEPRLMSDTSINRLRAVLLKRRRENRQQTMQDWARYGRDLPPAAQAAFSKELIADAKQDVDIELTKIVEFMQSMDKEGLATLLWCCSPQIENYEHAVKVIEAHGDLASLFELMAGGDEASPSLLADEQEALGNSSSHPETA